MNIGLWIPHEPIILCPGGFGSVSIQTRIHYTTSNKPDTPYIVGGCLSVLSAGNDALSMYQNAQLTIAFTMISAGKINLSLSVGGTYSFQPIVQVDGVTRLSAAGSTQVSLASGGHTLIFSITPVAMGTVPYDGIHLDAVLSF